MDDKFTSSVQQWLDTPAANRDIPAGATLLLQLNKNRILYQNIIRNEKKFAKKLEYELQKHLRIRLKRMTIRDVAVMEKEVMPAVADNLRQGPPVPDDDDTTVISTDEEPPAATRRGKRSDHDQLPEDIRNIYERGQEVFFKMKETYNTLLQMEDAQPCDRFELLQLLRELDTEYRSGWERYDNFRQDEKQDDDLKEETEKNADKDSSYSVSAARKFLSSNRKKLAELPPGDDRDNLTAKMQERIRFIQQAGESFNPDFRQQLETLGLMF